MPSAAVTLAEINAEVATASAHLKALEGRSHALGLADAEYRSLGDEMADLKVQLKQLEAVRRHISIRRAME